MTHQSLTASEKTEALRANIQELGFEIVGQRFKRLRTRLGISVRNLAESSHVSKNTITRVEKGLPVHLATLKQLARGLKLELPQILSKTFDSESTYAVHRIERSRWFDMMSFVHASTAVDLTEGNLRNVPDSVIPFSLLASRDQDGRFNPNFVRVTSATPPRSHRGEEFALVISGKIKVIFETNTIELSQGDSIFFWAAETHSYEPIGTTPVMILSIVLDPFPSAMPSKSLFFGESNLLQSSLQE